MISHLLVDIEVGGRGGIKTGQQLVDYDEQPHLARLFDKTLLDQFFKLFDPLGRLILRLLEIVGQHLAIDVVLGQLLRQPLARLLALDLAGIGLVTGDDGALASKTGLAEHLVTFAGLIDAGADQHGIATTIGQPGLALEVEQDIGHNLLQPRTTGEQLLH